MNTSSVNRLALEHFQELNEAWARESLQADHLRTLLDETEQRIEALEVNNTELSRAVETESLRINLASHFIVRPDDTEHTVHVLTELLPVELTSVSLLCCVKVVDQWIAIGPKGSPNHLRKFSFVVNAEDRAVIDPNDTSLPNNNMELIPVGMIPDSLREILQLGDAPGAMINMFSHCFWVLSGANVEIATSYLLERIGLLETATEIAMSAIAKHIQEMEFKLESQSQAVATKLARFLYQDRNLSGSLGETDYVSLASEDVKAKWLEIPRIIHPDFWNTNVIDKGVYRIEIFRLFTHSSSVNWSSALNLYTAPNGKLVKAAPGSAPAIAMEQRVVVMLHAPNSYESSSLLSAVAAGADEGSLRDGVLHLGLSSDESSDDAAFAGAVIIPVMAYDESASSAVLSRGCSGFIAIHKRPLVPKSPKSPMASSVSFAPVSSAHHPNHITPDPSVNDRRLVIENAPIGSPQSTSFSFSPEMKGLYLINKEEARKLLKVLRPSINILHEWMDAFEISDLDNSFGSVMNLLSMETVETHSAPNNQVDVKAAPTEEVLLEIDELYEIWDKFIDINTTRNHDSFPPSPSHGKSAGHDSKTTRNEPLSHVFAKKLRCHWCVIALIKEEEAKTSTYANISNLHVMDESGTVKTITGGDARYVRDSYRVLERHNEFIGNAAEYPEETRLAKLFHILLLNSQEGIDANKTMGLHMFQEVDLTKSHLLQTLFSKGLSHLVHSTDAASELVKCSLSVMVADAGIRTKDPTYPVVSAKLVVLGGRHLHGPHCWDRANGIRKLSSQMLLKMQSALRIRVMIHAMDIVLPSKQAELEDVERGREISRLEELGIKTLSLKLTKLIESCSAPGYTVVPGQLRCQYWHAIADTMPRALSSLSHVSLRRLKSEECLSFSFDLCIDDQLSGRSWFLYPNRSGSWGKDPTIPVSKKGYRSIVLYQSRGWNVDGMPSLVVSLRIYGIKGTSSDAASGAVKLSESGTEVCDRQNFASWVSTARLFFTTFESTFSAAHLSEFLFSIPTVNSSESPSLPFGYVPSQSDTVKNGVILDPATSAARTDAIVDFVTSIAADCVTVEPHILMSAPDEPNVACAWKDHSIAGASYLGSSMFWDRILSEFMFVAPRGVGPARTTSASTFVLPFAMLSQGSTRPIQLFDLIEANGSNVDDSFGLSSDVSILPSTLISAIGKYLCKDETDSNGPGTTADQTSDGVFFMTGEEASVLRDVLKQRSGVTDWQMGASSSGSGMAILVRGPLPIHSTLAGSKTEMNVSSSDIFTTSYHTIVFVSADYPISSVAVGRLIETVQAAFVPLRFLKPIMSLQLLCASMHDIIMPTLTSELKALDGDKLVDANEFEAGRAFPYMHAPQEYLLVVRRAIAICGSVCLSAMQNKPIGLSVNSSIHGAAYVRTKQSTLVRVADESGVVAQGRSGGYSDDFPSFIETSDAVLTPPMLPLFDDEDLAMLDETMDVMLNKSKFHVGLVEVPSKSASTKSMANNSTRDFAKSTDIFLKVTFYVPPDRMRGIFSNLCLPSDYLGTTKGVADRGSILGVVLVRVASDIDAAALFTRNKAEIPALTQIANSPTFAFAKRCIYSISQATNHFIDTTLTRANNLYDFSLFSQSLFDKTVDSFDHYITTSTNSIMDMLAHLTNRRFSALSDGDLSSIAETASAPSETFKITDAGVAKIVDHIVSHAESKFLEFKDMTFAELKIIDEKHRLAASKVQANESHIESLRAELQQSKRRSSDMDYMTRTFLKELLPRLLCGEVGRKGSKLLISGGGSTGTPMCYPPLHFEQMVCSLDEPLKWMGVGHSGSDASAVSLPYAMSSLLDIASFNKSLILAYTDSLCEIGSVEEVTSRMVLAYEECCMRDNAETDFFPNEAAVVWTRGKDEYTITTPYVDLTRGHIDTEHAGVTNVVYCTSECICGEVSHPSMLQWTIASGQCVLVDNATGSATLMSLESRSADGTTAGANHHNVHSMPPRFGDDGSMHQIPSLFPTNSTHKTMYIPIFIYTEGGEVQASTSKRRMSMMAAPIVSAGSTRELVAVVQYTDARAGLTERAATLKMCLEGQIYQTAKKMRSFSDSKKLSLQESIASMSLTGTQDGSASVAVMKPNVAQFLFPLELLRLSLFTSSSPHSEMAHHDARSLINDGVQFDWTTLAAYAGATAAGAMRGSAALLMLSKSGADVAGRIFKYRGDTCTVRQEDSVTVLKTEQLLEWCSRNKKGGATAQESDKIVRNVNDTSSIRPETPVAKFEFLPTPTFGISIFESRAQSSGEVFDEAQSPLRYHVLLPVHLPRTSLGEDGRTSVFENIKQHKDETPLVLAGYLLVETTRRLDSKDVIYAASITKLISFAAASKANTSKLQRYMTMLEHHASDMSVLQSELKRRDDFLVHYHRVHEFLHHSTRLVSDAAKVDGILADGEDVIKNLKRLVASELPDALGADHVRLFQISSDSMDTIRASLPIMDSSQLPLLSTYDDIVEKDEVSLSVGTSSLISGKSSASSSGSRRRNAVVAPSKYGTDDMQDAVSYVLPASERSKFTLSQACALANVLLQRLSSRKSRKRAESNSESLQMDGTDPFDSDKDPSLVMLHCRQGLVDAPGGPLCIVTSRSMDLFTIPTDAAGRRHRTAHSGDVWCLVLQFADINQWGRFVRTDEITDESYGVMNCATVAMYGVNVIVSAFEDSKWKSREQLQKLHLRELREFIGSGLDLVCKARSEGRVASVPAYALAASVALSSVGLPQTAIATAAEDHHHRNSKHGKSGVAINAINRFSDSVRDAFVAIEAESKDLAASFHNKILTCRFFWKQKQESRNANLIAPSISSPSAYDYSWYASTPTSASSAAEVDVAYRVLREVDARTASVHAILSPVDDDTINGTSSGTKEPMEYATQASDVLQSLLNRLVAANSSSDGSNTFLVKRIYTSTEKPSSNSTNKSSSNVESALSNEPQQHMIIVMYVPIVHDEAKELIHQGMLPAHGSGISASEDAALHDAATRTDVFDLPPAIMELHLCIPINSSGYSLTSIEKNVSFTEYFQLHAEEIDRDLLSCILYLREGLHMDYRTTVRDMVLRDLNRDVLSINNRSTSVLRAISNALGELYIDHGRLKSVMRQLESVLTTIAHVKRVNIRVFKALVGNNEENAGYPGNQSSIPPISPHVILNNFIQHQQQQHREITFTGSGIRVGSPSKVVLGSPYAKNATYDLLNNTINSAMTLPAEASYIVLYESELNSNTDTNARPLDSRVFDFACYEICGSITFEVDNIASFDEHERSYAALAKAIGRRAYELYRGHKSKKQLVEEQKKNIKLEADIANCNTEILRYKQQISDLTVVRGSLEDSLKHTEVETEKLKELLRSEQQALQNVMLDKRDQDKQARRVMADVKSEHDKRERDLRKSIQDLSRGVHAGDKTYMALRTELDQAQNKIKILETKKADILEQYQVYKVESEARIRNQEALIASLQTERLQIREQMLSLQEKARVSGTANDDRLHALVAKLRAVEDELASLKVANESLHLQLSNAASDAAAAEDEALRIRSEYQTKLSRSQERLEAAEKLIKQIYDHKKSLAAAAEASASSAASQN